MTGLQIVGTALIVIGLIIALAGVLAPSVNRSANAEPPTELSIWSEIAAFVMKLIDIFVKEDTKKPVALKVLGVLVMLVGVALLFL